MHQSKLFKFIFAITCIMMLYNFGAEQVMPKIEKVKSENSFLNANPVNDPTKDTYNFLLENKSKANLSYAEKKLAGVLAAFLETPEGKSYANSMLKSNSYNPLQEILGSLDYKKPHDIESLNIEKSGLGNNLRCGAVIDVKEIDSKSEYKVNIGKDDMIKLSGYIFNMAKEGDIRIVKYKNGTTKKYEILKVIENPWKDNISEHNVYNIIKGYIVPYCGTKFAVDVKIINDKAKVIHKFRRDDLIYNFHKEDHFFADIVLSNNLGGQTIIVMNNKQIISSNIVPKDLKLENSSYYVIDINTRSL